MSIVFFFLSLTIQESKQSTWPSSLKILWQYAVALPKIHSPPHFNKQVLLHVSTSPHPPSFPLRTWQRFDTSCGSVNLPLLERSSSTQHKGSWSLFDAERSFVSPCSYCTSTCVWPRNTIILKQIPNYIFKDVCLMWRANASTLHVM